MGYQGIIITGTRCSGKSTVARELCRKSNTFALVEAITTRGPRPDDAAGQYKYVTPDEFDNLSKCDALLVEVRYRGNRYGVLRSAFEEVLSSGRVPILIGTPQFVSKVVATTRGEAGDDRAAFWSVFLDASDTELDRRLADRDGQVPEAERDQRERDRAFRRECLYSLNNSDLVKTCDLLYGLWAYRETGGVIPRRLIRLMIDCGTLLEKAAIENITGAAYDLSLGDEYYYGGRIRTLTDKEPFVMIEPYDYAIVTSRELANLPRDVCGRFGLCVSLFCQGIMLSNGPQVDPGFRGRLFCTLFNISNCPVLLKRGQHYATLVLHKLVEPTDPYEGKYQDKEQIISYLPPNAMRGAINELKRELERIRAQTQLLQSIFLGVISLVLSIIAVLLARG